MVDKCWNKLEKIIQWFIYDFFKLNLSSEQMNSLLQFIKFGIVGISNNVICYVTYLFFLWIGLNYLVAYFLGFTVSVFNSYYWNNKYVFEQDSQRAFWTTFIKTYISYSMTGIVLGNILLFLWVDIVGVPKEIAPLINLVITIPANFILNKLWAFKRK